MKYEERLEDWLIKNAFNTAHASPAIKGLCHLLDEDRLVSIPLKYPAIQPHEQAVFEAKIKP